MAQVNFPVLIGDIGGTNARFQILPEPTAPVVPFDHFRTADFDTIEDAIAVNVLAKTDLVPRTAILAAAGPITADGLDLTNCEWNVRPDVFLAFSAFDDLILFNDFDAQSLALPSLGLDHLVSLGPSAAGFRDATKVVIGPGTGCGVGTLVRTPDQWVPVGGEGGHVDLGPRTPRESDIWPHLKSFEGRVSAESVLSGPGIENLYSAICSADSTAPVHSTAAQISGAALENSDQQAAETMSVFFACLGRVAGDLALTLMPKGGIYIAGGIVRRVPELLHGGEFIKGFTDKAPHSEILAKLPIYLIIHEDPALLGLAAFARSPQEFSLFLSDRRWTR